MTAMRRLLIDGTGLVVNAVELEAESTWQPPEGLALLPPETEGNIGDSWDGEACLPPAPAAAPVPETITRFQGRTVLRQAGLLGRVEAWIVALDDAVALDAWQHAGEWRRASPLIEAARLHLELSPEQMDALFRQAAAIEV